MSRRRLNIAGMLPARLMLIVALVLAAFAHSPATSAAIEKAQYAAAYTLPDGTTPILCDPTGDDDHAGFKQCAFCLIASSASLNGNDNPASCAIAFVAEAIHFRTDSSDQRTASRLLTTSAPRAPPHRGA